MVKDPETDKVLKEGEQVATFVDSADWQAVKGKVIDKMKLLDSLTSMDLMNMSNEQIIREVVGRVGALTIMAQWINEIEGIATQHKATVETITEVEKVVIRLPEE